MSEHDDGGPPAVKDQDAQHPIAGAWRPILRAVVSAFAQGDFGLTTPIAGVESVDSGTAEQIRCGIAAYGDVTLIDLPDDTWQTSVAQWMGTHWDVLVDLWTVEEGRSDLVLGGRIMDAEAGLRFEVGLVYVP